MDGLAKIAFGGGCHWCTEAVFQSLKGVKKVEQGYVASTGKESTLSEAVIVHFNLNEIPLKPLIEVHLHTHKSTSNHSMRSKYRSAIYSFSKEQANESMLILDELNSQFDHKLITRVLPFGYFKVSRTQIQNYYYRNPEKPFCRNFINPKLQFLLSEYSGLIDHNQLAHLKKAEK
ncbi:peptide-methionine (S)-S-oxide reductase [Flavisericum labens]|uniref:peptide-methionine (S)-S-oxide reductase n=1 Tax=Flavisericum labens TaxID=3377112 RepID=UPI00387B4BEB